MRKEDAMISEKDEFCIVYELPEKLTNGFAFRSQPIPFMNVDWFNCSTIVSNGNLIEFVKNKRYYNLNKDYIILRGEHKVLRIPKKGKEGETGSDVGEGD